MKELNGKAAVVTGAGSGIGRAIAHSLASAGVAVAVADIELHNAEAVAAEIIAAGGRAIGVRTDVAKLADVEALADAAYQAFGDIHILVNNAGVAFRPFRAIWDTSHADFEWMVGVNIWGVIHGIEVFVPRMRAIPGEKHIVNTSSISTLLKVPGNATYTMTKFAVDGLSEIIREELEADNIGVTILYPGHILTNVSKSGRLRSAEEQARDAELRSYVSYAEERGEAPKGDPSSSAGGAVNLIGAGDVTRGIEPSEVGPMVVAAIKANRLYCMTHPAPREGIETRTNALLDGYIPG
ncbi:SDR family NAD(P)-dependent oxidoreductase [Rhizorhapis suberifaciens]|uniref:NAD(P)-dependent dehydrogenase (Short-subunit alcohol dehydrogenase family) n=1 Tax=Rhizorhapis suberifaciens TaxID=13656 RepID=A0A840HRE5_9SPHN|nr:SDR family NAD(P)-dependent oxidoreductase [Rhizorhapis suberifaciens]MBB4640168.1 NAD(P)-dependent dehydrogenase (short-subunit alcohol dehydrogenase family) [Rhizorhapis suberifaciens]